MGMNATPSSDRVHIGIFGKRNAGKSSLINAITGQSLSIVSDQKGTTTDPVSKAMELLPLGPVVMIDTPGLDDEGSLGEMRVKKAWQVLNKTDIAVLVAEASEGLGAEEENLLAKFREKNIPYVIVLNKADLLSSEPKNIPEGGILVSASTQAGIHELKEKIASLVPEAETSYPICSDLIQPGDLAVLVIPIDSAAPKGRLILPQQQTIRDILEADGICVVTKETTLKESLSGLAQKPRMVITDSQAFEQVAKDTPEDIILTSFSILFARHKGKLKELAEGAKVISQLKDQDKILISEGCTHHRQCEDIGTVKLPAWLKRFTGKELQFTFTSGTEFSENLEEYALVIHCGGCMLNQREMQWRIRHAVQSEVPITNYGTAIAYMKGILDRSLEVFDGRL